MPEQGVEAGLPGVVGPLPAPPNPPLPPGSGGGIGAEGDGKSLPEGPRGTPSHFVEQDLAIEAADSVAPHRIGFKLDDGRVTAKYYVDGRRFRDQCLFITGYNVEGTDGRIRRSLPCTFGQLDFLFASSINLTGLGVNDVVPSTSSQAAILAEVEMGLEGLEEDEELIQGENGPQRFFIDTGRRRQIRAHPIHPLHGLYPVYEAEVEFLQRPYHVLPDDQIRIMDGIWYNEEGEEAPYVYVNEWDRFTEFDVKTDPKIITATQGQLVFRTEDGVGPHGAAFAGTPRIPFPETMLTVTFHQVPFHYVTHPSSYLERFMHRVNQHAFTLQGVRYEPGELLYHGYSYKRYTPPFPPLDPDDENGVRFLLEKWVDVTMIFYVARREAENPPTLPNPNWIASRGHNVLPWFGPGNASSPRRKFYYVASYNRNEPLNKAYWQPLFESAPIPELLFMDPAFDQPQ